MVVQTAKVSVAPSSENAYAGLGATRHRRSAQAAASEVAPNVFAPYSSSVVITRLYGGAYAKREGGRQKRVAPARHRRARSGV